MSRHDWSDVRERVERLAAEPEAGEVFGSVAHRWVLEPPLSGEEMAELEGQLRVELPGEYRSFLLQAGRGGAGPAYGLWPLRRVDERWRWEGDGADLTALDKLDQPFPHVEAFDLEDGLPDRPDESGFASEADFDAAEKAYWERLEAVYRQNTVGLLYLCHLGCAFREALVVSGPARGQMWADLSAEGNGFQPLRDDDGTPLGFARWYRRWLDEAEAQVFGDRP